MGDTLLSQYEILFRKACSDMSLALCGFNANDQSIDSATLLFHLQQGAEKLFKSLLAFKGIHFEKTHDLKVLMNMCRDNTIDLPADVIQFKELNPFAEFGRYDIFEDEEIDFMHYYNLVKELQVYVEKKIFSSSE